MKAYPSPLGPGRIDSKGYWSISLRKDGDRPKGKYRLHRLFWAQAHGPIPPRGHIDHLDEDKQNCCLSNLKCRTPGDHNTRHFLGKRPSHLVTAEGEIVKRCCHCQKLFPLAALHAHRTPSGGIAYSAYCRPCHGANYGWASQRQREARRQRAA